MEIDKNSIDFFVPLTGDIFKTLIEKSPVPNSLYIGRQLVIGLANDAMLRLWGKDGSVIGKPYWEALPELKGQPVFQLLEEVYNTGQPYQAREDRLDLLVNGRFQTFYFNFTFTPLKDEDGNVWGILNTATDVTELVLTRQHLIASEEQKSFSLDAAELGTWELDPVNYTIKWDERSKELLGADVSDSVSFEEALEYVHVEDRDNVQKAVICALDPLNGSGYSVEFRTAKTAKGSERWLLGKGKAYFNSRGGANRCAGTLLDITDEVKARQEREKLLTLVEHSADAMAVADLDTSVIYINKACQLLLGFSDRKALKVRDFYPPEVFEWVKEHVWPKVSEEGSWKGNLTLRHAETGVHIPVFTNFICIYDPINGSIIGRAATLRDLRPEIRSQLEQRKLLSLVENTDDFIAVANLDGNLVYLNKAGLQLIGANSLFEAIRPFSELLAEDDKVFFDREILNRLNNQGKWSGKLKFRHLLFEENILCFVNMFMISDPMTDGPTGIACVARDLRPELAAQKALAESEQLFRDITTAAPAALWMTDVNGDVTYVNQIWADWTGMPLEWHQGKGWLDMIVPEDRDHVEEKFNADFKVRALHESEFRIKGRDGNEHYIVFTGNPQYDPYVNFKGYIGAAVDITEQKQLQNQKDEFLSIASHELKTPITSMKAYLQVLSKMLDDRGDKSLISFAAKANKQVNKLTSLISDLLDVTKIQAGKMVLNITPVDLNDLVNSFNEQHLLSDKHYITVKGSCNVMVNGDWHRLEQVMENLISNASKYSPDSDEIIITIEQLPDKVKISVTDFGIGIPEEKLSLVFDRFFRVEKTSQQFSGLGLGLFISYQIVKQHGGEMGVTSKEGVGSTFWFSLPY